MEANFDGDVSPRSSKWRKIAYGGMQPGFDDNHTDDSFLEEMVTNANVIKHDMLKVMLDSVCISQYICIVTLVVLVWIYTLESTIDENTLLLLDVSLLGLGLFILLLTAENLSISLLLNYILKISFLIGALYVLSPIYHTLTRSICSDSIWALTVSLIILHLFLHDYSGPTINAPRVHEPPSLTRNISLNASIMASLLIASRLPSRLYVFAFVLFSLQIFLFAPLVIYSVKKYSFRLHIFFSFGLIMIALGYAYMVHKLFCVLLLSSVLAINVVCPYWLIRIQEYKFEINGPWDEAKLCFNITD